MGEKNLTLDESLDIMPVVLFKKKILIPVLLLFISACLAQSGKPVSAEAITKYYAGKVITTSPDGSTPYGPAKFSLVKRSLDQKNKRITEWVSQDGKVFDTKLIQQNNSAVFNAQDSAKTFSGILTFSGDNWKWNSWIYDITMTDGSGKISGKGFLTNEGIKTEKYFTKGNIAVVKITEDLKEINYEEFIKQTKK